MNTDSACPELLTGNMLKIIALISMTVDHIGAVLFPEFIILRIVGRLAFPVFAYSIAEGCRYTQNRAKYFLRMFLLGILCQIVYYVTEKSLNMCILITFSLSVIHIYALDYMTRKKTAASFIAFFLLLTGTYYVSAILPGIPGMKNFYIDYGFFGILTPVIIYIAKTKEQKIFYTLAALCAVSLTNGNLQWYSIAAIPLLMMYNGKRGKAKIKNLFYIYYPLHLAIIHIINLIL